ncbi:MAG: hypothetical protein CL470_08370 [Acidimicrobiaceae bacterium]|nr:hypothetical protein [Acidimicrobiaceae bacterium]
MDESMIVSEIRENRIICSDVQDTIEINEVYIIQLLDKVSELTNDLIALKESVDESMVPTIDQNILSMIIATIIAVTICLVVCLLIICYTNRIETKEERRRRIVVQQKDKHKSKIDIP